MIPSKLTLLEILVAIDTILVQGFYKYSMEQQEIAYASQPKKTNKSGFSLQPLCTNCQTLHDYVRREKRLYFLAASPGALLFPAQLLLISTCFYLITSLFSCSLFQEGDAEIKFAAFPFQH